MLQLSEVKFFVSETNSSRAQNRFIQKFTTFMLLFIFFFNYAERFRLNILSEHFNK